MSKGVGVLSKQSESRPAFPKRAVVTAGMPYGNKGLHFGHIGGVYVPADMTARFLRNRIGAENVLFVSGTDCYGSPIMEGHRKAVESGEFDGTIEEYVLRNHWDQKDTLDAYSISLNIFEGSGLGYAAGPHKEMTDYFFETLYANGYLERLSTAQFYDTEADMFLNGRQVIGRCPVQGCKSEKAYADECDLGHQFNPEELIAPKSTITGTVPELRPVDNWYFKLPEFGEIIREHVENLREEGIVRPFALAAIEEFLEPPIIYIQTKFAEDFQAAEANLPAHTVHEAQEGKTSFTVEFPTIGDRDEARAVLERAGVRFRTGKTLVPFRLTGNIDWGVVAPTLEDEDKLTVWCWPESLWAPISFSDAVLRRRGGKPGDWRDWWCSDDARVYQFIGEDNIYFYGVAQSGLWPAMQVGHEPQAEGTGEDLRQTDLIANHHLLFLNSKASSSGKVKPPMAQELLEHYNAEQLRAHFLALGLGLKSVSFQPKPYDPNANEKAPDPVLKESALLTNIFNRLARSCFYTAQKVNSVTFAVGDSCDCGHEHDFDDDYAEERAAEHAHHHHHHDHEHHHHDHGHGPEHTHEYSCGRLPLGEPSATVKERAEETILEYERLMSRFELHAVMALMDTYLRDCNKYWAENSKRADASDDPQDYIDVLRDAFYMLRVATLLMEPVAPVGTRKIFDYLQLGCTIDEFLSWDHIFEGYEPFVTIEDLRTGSHELKFLPPRTDFFEKHPSQFK